MNLGHRPDGTPHEKWIASGAALDSAREWFDADDDEHPTDAELLDAYLGTAQADDDHHQWCADQIRDHLGDRADEARAEGRGL